MAVGFVVALFPPDSLWGNRVTGLVRMRKGEGECQRRLPGPRAFRVAAFAPVIGERDHVEAGARPGLRLEFEDSQQASIDPAVAAGGLGAVGPLHEEGSRLVAFEGADGEIEFDLSKPE